MARCQQARCRGFRRSPDCCKGLLPAAPADRVRAPDAAGLERLRARRGQPAPPGIGLVGLFRTGGLGDRNLDVVDIAAVQSFRKKRKYPLRESSLTRSLTLANGALTGSVFLLPSPRPRLHRMENHMRAFVKLSLIASIAALAACSSTTEPISRAPSRDMSGYMLGWTNRTPTTPHAVHSGYIYGSGKACGSSSDTPDCLPDRQ